MMRRTTTTIALIAYAVVAALGYAVGYIAAAVYTVGLWLIGAIIAGFRRGRGHAEVA